MSSPPAKRARTLRTKSMGSSYSAISASSGSEPNGLNNPVILLSDSDTNSIGGHQDGDNNAVVVADRGGENFDNNSVVLSDGYADDFGFDELDEAADEEYPEVPLHFDDEVAFNDPGGAVLGQAMVDEQLHVASVLLASGGSSITLIQVQNEIRITLLVDDLEQLALDAYGLSFHPIQIAVILPENSYRRTASLPAVRVRHGEIETSSQRANKRFAIGLQLTHATRAYLVKSWNTSRSDEFLYDLCELLSDRLKNAGNYCMMCDCEIPFPGVKPTVCNQHLCAYQLEGLGLGAGIALFDTDPKVADLLISFAAAACWDIHRQISSPLAMPPPGGDNVQVTPADLRELFEKLPPTTELMFSEAERSKFLKTLDPRFESHVAWLFATNRAHIVSLPQELHFKQMNTPHQFKIHTSTREHAKKFEQLRAAHGSFFAFHGSSMSNWHNILRQNLKNASHTPLMSAGAAYGEGIYMALNSTTSAGYSRMTGGWKNSQFGMVASCIALVEVANSSRVHKHANGIVVAADESCAMLRYLFVYGNSTVGAAADATTAPTPALIRNPPTPHPFVNGGIVTGVEAKSLASQRYCNPTTIAFGSTYDEVVESGNLLITDNDTYFWDIEEVVHMVKSKHGLFINGFTHLPFAAADVRKILAHPKAEPLRAMERTNAELRIRIPQSVITHLNLVGHVCRSDQTEDFHQALPAIAELQTWIKALDKPIKDALGRVPFTMHDSHTGQQLRNTVSHAVELVTSGGECVHRFGDFLAQIR